jgi:hypothetical protein
MPRDKPVHFYLPYGMRAQAASGKHNFINKLMEVLREAGFGAEFHETSLLERLKGSVRPGYSITCKADPFNEKSLKIHQNYFLPFWQIEKTAARWERDVTFAQFDPSIVPAKEANRFFHFWRNRIFGDMSPQPSGEGYVYVPLQARLPIKRSFQSCSPMEMLEITLRECGSSKVVATIHPRHEYMDAELAALHAFADKQDRLTIDTGNMETHLANCRYIVTQNSSVAISGYFHERPVILFAEVDFHHIAL